MEAISVLVSHRTTHPNWHTNIHPEYPPYKQYAIKRKIKFWRAMQVTRYHAGI